MSVVFQDGQSYNDGRPRYPENLYSHLEELTNGFSVALDCCTGTGQVATRIRDFIPSVFAIDVSLEQLAAAPKREGICYVQSKGESLPFLDESVELITAAAAYHWMEGELFLQEAFRVLKDGGVLAIWTYSIKDFTSTARIDQVMATLRSDLEHYWPDSYRSKAKSYEELRFPEGMDEILDKPEILKMEATYSLDMFINMIESWSASQEFLKSNGERITARYVDALSEAWTENSVVQVQFPFSTYRLARKITVTLPVTSINV